MKNILKWIGIAIIGLLAVRGVTSSLNLLEPNYYQAQGFSSASTQKYYKSVIYDDAGAKKAFQTSFMTDAFPVSAFRGAITLGIETDTLNTAGGSESDSCWTVTPQVKINDVWFDYYVPGGADTLARSQANTGGSNLYFPAANFNTNAVGDSIRFNIAIGNGDRANARVTVGMQ